MKKEINLLYNQALAFYNAGSYKKALQLLRNASPEILSLGAFLILNSDCLYELGHDIKALEGYIEYCKRYPRGRARNFALFNAAICLKNSGAEEEAVEILALVKKNHQGLNAELIDSVNRVKKLRLARKCYASFMHRT